MKLAFRQLLKNPGFTAVAVLTLALGIGANTAIFGVLYRVVLKPLPFPDAGRLVRMQVHSQERDQSTVELTALEFATLEKESGSFEHLGAFSGQIRNLSGAGIPLRAWGTRVSPDFFSTLGITPLIGRLFGTEEYAPGANQVLLLNHALWQERFGGRSDIVGKTVILDGKQFVVCGVMPASFRFPHRLTSYWTPLVLSPDEISETNSRFLSVVGRLKQGVSQDQLRDRLRSLSRGYQETSGTAEAGEVTFVGISLLSERLGRTGHVLWLLFAAVSCATLIGAANLINLYLSRVSMRQKEIAVRIALGASRRRILRQWLAESCLLSLVSGLVGVTLAGWCVHLLRTFAPYGLPRADEIAIDPTIVGFGFALALLVGAGSSIIPLAQFLTRNKAEDTALSSRERGSPAGRRTRSWLVATQAAIATVLLIGAVLLWDTFRGVIRVDPGFSADQLLTARIVLSHDTYDDGDSRRNFYRQLTERVSTLPEVAGVGMVNSLPLSEIDYGRPFSIEYHEEVNGLGDESLLRGNYTSVSVNYFQLMGIPVLAGRPFEPSDESGPPVVVVNESLTKRFFPGGEAVGRRIKLGPGNWRPWMTIVGIAADVKSSGRDKPSEPRFYVPCLQKELPAHTMRGMFLVVKTRAAPEAVVSRLRSELSHLDPNLALANIDTMDARLQESVSGRQYHSTLMGLFAGLALLLALIGIFGVLSCVVADRRREIGVRMALGSNRAALFKLILKQGLKPVVIGVLCGWAIALMLRGVMTSLLFGVSAHDPTTFLLVGVLFTATATLACLVPAYRAANTNPMEALRYE